MDGFDKSKLLSGKSSDAFNKRADKIKERVNLQAKNLEKIAQNMKEIDKVMEDVSKDLDSRLDRISQLNASTEQLKTANANLHKQSQAMVQAQHGAARGMMGKIAGQQQSMQIREDVAAGRVNKSDVEQNLEKTTQKLIETFNKLDKAVSQNAVSAGKLSDEFNEVAKEYDKHVETLNVLSQSGGGGSNIAGYGRMISGGMRSASNVIGAYGNYEQYEKVTSELADIQNRTRLGSFANEEFMTQYGAAQGDAKSITRLMNYSFRNAREAGARVGEGQSEVLETKIAGESTSLAGDIVDGITNIFSGFGAGGKLGALKGAMDSAGNIAGGVSQVAITGTDISKDISKTQALTSTQEAKLAQEDVKNLIPSLGIEQVINQLKGGGVATRGLGGARAETMNTLMDENFVQQMAGQGIGMQDMRQMTAMGRSMLGSEFNLRSAGNLAGRGIQAGLMESPEQYMQMAGMMTGVGGQSNDLENIMKTAVAAGMDSSKNVMEMAQSTRMLAESSANLGISTVSGSAEMMGIATQALKDTVPKNMRNQAALAAIQGTSSKAMDESLSMGSLFQTAKLQDRFEGASLLELEAMKKLTPQQLKEASEKMEGGDTNYLREKYGITSIKNLEDLKFVQETQSRKVELNTGATYMDSEGANLSKRLREGDTTLTPEEKAKAENYNKLRDTTEGYSQTTGLKAMGAGSRAEKGSLEDQKLSVEKAISGAFEAQSKLFEEGKKDAEAFSGSVDKFAEYIGRLGERLDPGEGSSKTTAAVNELKIPDMYGDAVVKIGDNLQPLVEQLTTLNDMLNSKVAARKALKDTIEGNNNTGSGNSKPKG